MFQGIERISDAEEGLTLIELIIVVAIMGILATVITPRVLEAVDTARTNTVRSMAHELMKALERYAARHGEYPSEEQVTEFEDLSTVLQVVVGSENLHTPVFQYVVSDDLGDYCLQLQAANRERTTFWIGSRGVFTGPVPPEDYPCEFNG